MAGRTTGEPQCARRLRRAASSGAICGRKARLVSEAEPDSHRFRRRRVTLEAGESSNRAVGWEGNPRAVPPHEYRAQAEPLNPIGPRDSRESCNPSSPEVTV